MKAMVKVPVKEEMRQLLVARDFGALGALVSRKKGAVRYLTSFLYSENDLLHWRAAEALGAVTKDQTLLSPEKVNTVISRMFLNLEDQSGGNGWGAIEGIGAMIAARPYTLDVHIPKMFSLMHDARLWKGLLWSVRRIGEQRPELFADRIHLVIGLVRNPSNTARGHAAWALGAIGDSSVVELLEALKTDKSRIRIYEDGELREVTVGELATRSLAEITSGPQHFKPRPESKKPLRTGSGGRAAGRLATLRHRSSR